MTMSEPMSCICEYSIDMTSVLVYRPQISVRMVGWLLVIIDRFD